MWGIRLPPPQRVNRQGAKTAESRKAVVPPIQGVANSDSPTNLMWRMENDFSNVRTAKPEEDPDDEPSFTEITLDVKH